MNDPEYTQLLGDVVYAVSGLEWRVLGDLASVQPPLAGFDIKKFVGLTTNAIGRAALKLSEDLEDDPEMSRFLSTAAEAVADVAQRRNHVLHARPATDPQGQQRLLRLRWFDDKPINFWIDEEYLHGLLAVIREWETKIGRAPRVPGITI